MVVYYHRFLFKILRNFVPTPADFVRSIQQLETIFSRFGILKVLFADSDTQLTSNEMRGFTEQADFIIVMRSPAYHEANNKAEYCEKQVLTSEKPWLVLLNYRVTPISFGFSPGELLMKPKLRTLIPTFSHETNVLRKVIFQNH